MVHQAEEPTSAKDVVEQVTEVAAGETVSFGDLLAKFGRRAFGPLLLVPSLIALLPSGAIPGMSAIVGSIILLVSAQLLIGRDAPWLPRRLLSVRFDADKVAKAGKAGHAYAVWIDRWIGPRLTALIDPPFVQIVAAVCIVMAGLMYPFALLPFAAAAPAFTVSLLALGLTASDGLLTIAGFIAALSTVGLGLYIVV